MWDKDGLLNTSHNESACAGEFARDAGYQIHITLIVILMLLSGDVIICSDLQYIMKWCMDIHYSNVRSTSLLIVYCTLLSPPPPHKWRNVFELQCKTWRGFIWVEVLKGCVMTSLYINSTGNVQKWTLELWIHQCVTGLAARWICTYMLK